CVTEACDARTSVFFFFYGSGHPRDLHSFPTRRSSDLQSRCADGRPWLPVTDRSAHHRHREPWAAAVAGVTRQCRAVVSARRPARSEEHTSELQSRENLVCRLLLEKKNKRN